MKRILGLDLGTNSVGWAIIEKEESNSKGRILGMGSRIIPMGQELSKFEQGQAQTKNANRRLIRGARKLNKRYKQRRNKLIYIMQKLGMLPDQIKLDKPFENPLTLDRVCILPISKKEKQLSALNLVELRVKALSEAIPLKDFGKIIYLFNQLRGYSGGGNEPEKEQDSESIDSENKKNESYIVFGNVISVLKIEQVEFKGKKLNKKTILFDTEDGVLEGETYVDSIQEGDTVELLVKKTNSKKNGTSIQFKLPVKTDWRKKMENLEKELNKLKAERGREIYLSEYFLEILKENPWAKIRDNVVLRSRYQAEFDAIWKEQTKYHPVLTELSQSNLEEILNFIFPGSSENQAKFRNEGIKKGLKHVIRNQVIYFQRELKDQSHLISDCRFEKGKKVVAKSHPTFQEYKIWEQINKLSINTKFEIGTDRKGKPKFKYVDRSIPITLKEWLFDELKDKKEIGFNAILSKLKKEYGFREGTDFLNGINPKAKIKGDETKWILKKALGENNWEKLKMDLTENQIELWNILYNINGNEYDLDSDRTKAVRSFLAKYLSETELDDNLVIQISKIRFSRNYAALSLEAINKVLPLVRCGKYFNNDFSDELNRKINRLLNEVVTDPFDKAAQNYLDENADLLEKGGVINAYALILMFDKHTAKEYSTDQLINDYHQIKALKQGELRNPLVEQLINESLMVVKDIWRSYGKPDEIRIELARELKNNAERRAKIYKSNNANQKVNEEIKSILLELNQEISLRNIEKYKLWQSQENDSNEFLKQYHDPSKTEIERVKLWREQGHVSPYTGQTIPLSELFNRERYDIDHIIPQSRYFDDSLSNKVICEKAVNKEKSNRTAMEFIESGSKIPYVFSKEDFVSHINRLFDGQKRKNLLATKVPEDPIARQIKETQYIAVRFKEEMNKIVGNNNVKSTTGGVTDYLRNQWGLTDKFKKLVVDRYEKMKDALTEAEYEKRKDTIKDKDAFIESYKKDLISRKNNKLVIKGWSKRIDHRHHALDALIVACTEPKHIKRLNDLNKEIQSWLDKNRQKYIPDFEGNSDELLDAILNLEERERTKIFSEIEKFRAVDMPWTGFPEEAEQALNSIIVSQKPKDKLLIQREERKDKTGKIVKTDKLQIKIRSQLHESTIYGKSQGVEAYRIPLSKLAGKQFATEKTIEKVTNPFLREELTKHLKSYKSKEEAFSAEGILELNKKLEDKVRNKEWKRKGKTKKIGEKASHTPINSIKVFYRDPSKIKKKKGEVEIQDTLQKLDRKKSFNDSLYVKTGDNYLFAVLEKNGKRIFDVLTLFDAANLLRSKFVETQDKSALNKELIFKKYFELENEVTKGAKLLFTLKQGDYVYLPNTEEYIDSKLVNGDLNFFQDKKSIRQNIYVVTKFSGKEIYFIKNYIAQPILKGVEFGSQNAVQVFNGLSIKEFCVKVELDRLGNVVKVYSGNS
jgi:CRISPR/Cas system Type II protein with McrA/HNH and RuvC-like nuclease domain